MTFPSASRRAGTFLAEQRFAQDAMPISADDAARAPSQDRPASVTLGELIDDSGPLPADAALECLQRVAEQLQVSPVRGDWPPGPSEILIDDDGGIQLLASSRNGRPPGDDCSGRRVSDELTRLLAYLTTADRSHLSGELDRCATAMPSAVVPLARRLAAPCEDSRASYELVARGAAELRGAGGAPAICPDESASKPADPGDRTPGAVSEPALKPGRRSGRWWLAAAVAVLLLVAFWMLRF